MSSNKLLQEIKRCPYWKRLKRIVNNQVKPCVKCNEQNLKPIKYADLHKFTAVRPSHKINRDFIGENEPTRLCHKSAFTAIDQLSGFVIATSLLDKTADWASIAFLKSVVSIFGSRFAYQIISME